MKKKKFTIQKTPERAELMRLMASEDPTVRIPAMQAFAGFLRPLVQRLLDQKAVVNYIYSDVPIGRNDRPTIPLDPYVNYKAGEFRIWAQTVAGGLPTNYTQGLSEMPFIFYKLDSALSLSKDFIEDARLDLMARAITRVVQEFVAKQEINGWTPILSALVNGYNTNGLNHSISPTTAGRFQANDLNALIVRAARLYESFAGGSIQGDYGLTDLFMSPERMADVRGFSYQPMNTVAVPDTAESTVLGLPDKVREEIFRASGAQSMWNITFHELRELGLGKKLNVIYDTQLANVAANTFNYDNTTEDLVLGFDLNQDVFLRPVKSDSGGGTLKSQVDDQFYVRSGKVGWFWSMEESRVVLDNRPIVAVKV